MFHRLVEWTVLRAFARDCVSSYKKSLALSVVILVHFLSRNDRHSKSDFDESRKETKDSKL